MAQPAYSRDPSLPDYADPPLVEAVLGVEFEAIDALGAVAMVTLAQSWAPDLPVIREMPGLPPSAGTAGQPVIISGGPIPLRLWAMSNDESLLFQIQNDRLILNWRSTDGTTYPRYSNLRTLFSLRWTQLVEHLEAIREPSPIATYVEATFVNQYSVLNGLDATGGLSFVHALPESMPGSGGSLAFQLRRALVYQEPPAKGRLAVEGTPSDDGEQLRLTITAKLQPTVDTSDLAVLLPILDRAHDAAVKAFDAATIGQQHAEWQKLERGGNE